MLVLQAALIAGSLKTEEEIVTRGKESLAFSYSLLPPALHKLVCMHRLARHSGGNTYLSVYVV